MSEEVARSKPRRLPSRRTGFTVEATVGGQKVIFTTGEFEDGSLGEIFIQLPKADSQLSSQTCVAAIAISKGLQYGVPLEEFVESFVFIRSDPMGVVLGHPNIKMATSIWDFIFRVLGHHYLKREDLVNVQGPSELVSELYEQGVEGPRLDEAVMNALADQGTSLDQALAEMMGDAPFCKMCGHITIRDGAAYRCLNCGNSSSQPTA